MDRQKVAKEAIANFDKSHPHSSSEAKNFYIAGWLDGVQRFYSLVKKMREAQKEWESQPSFKWGDTSLFNTLRKLEKEVDEYLKEDGYMTKKEWKIGDVGYFFYTYLWQTMKATVTMTTNDYLVVTDEFGHIHRVEKEDFYKTEEEVELSL